jgi:threonine/homoserine/homoserine lactone efflux protein
MKYVGVAYLLSMAWATWRDRGALTVDEDAAPRSARRVITSGVLINILNPKLTIFFFFAFLPQFVSTSDSNVLVRMLGLSAVFMAMTFIVFAVYGGFAAAARQDVISRPRFVTGMRTFFAFTFVALGARLAADSR